MADDGTAEPALVRAAQRGDTFAMAELLDRLAPFVSRICGPIALNSGADAAQDTLIVVFRSLRSLRDPAALFGWVRTVAVREAIRHARRDSSIAPKDAVAMSTLPGRDDPELLADVRAVLTRLTPELRAVLVLRDLEGFDEAAAARLLEVPAGTVKSRLHRARRLFRTEWVS